jgi:hypothetical protein
VFNLVNLHGYHYAGNNPVKYVDPDGEETGIPDITGYFDSLIMKCVSLPAVAFGNVVSSAKNFFSNIGNGEGSFSMQFGARLVSSQINISLNVSGTNASIKLDPNLISSLEAVAGSPIRTKYDSNNNLTGVEFHVGVGDVAGTGKISAILGGFFDTETGDATGVIGGKLSGIGVSEKTSVNMKLLFKASTIGNNPTVQGRDFVNNFDDQNSRDRFNEAWSDPF